eukprot:TRINITY_DN1282_c6_g1_i1.p1 TRINITY_DN1282_c6_g1~~TRINITY_DN1282_c6_g1_i1.p1  ORF type:complete len:151 (+),score=28.07 TRINITY_DN1282_c6_g1_i1:58-510(+)
MCDYLFWESEILADGNDGVYALNEEEVDNLLSTVCSSVTGDQDSSSEDVSSESVDADVDIVDEPVEKRKYLPCPCSHNTWDNVRAKKECLTLRCRICSAQWKTITTTLRRCRNFPTGNCNDSNCPYTHIYRFKFSTQKRNTRQGRRNVRH